MRRNMADPSYEPSDEDLVELAKEAFAHLPAADKLLRLQLREQIADARRRVLNELREKQGR